MQNNFVKWFFVSALLLMLSACGGNSSSDFTENSIVGSVGLSDSLFPKQGNGGYDTQDYNISLTWGKSGEIKATTIITALAIENLNGFYLDFHGLIVNNIIVNGFDVEFQREDNELKILLPKDMILQKGEEFKCTILYHGTPTPIIEGKNKVGWIQSDNAVFVSSQVNGAMSWYPCNNHPSDKATYSFEIRVPKEYMVVANGIKIGIRENDETVTYLFRENYPMASYLSTVNIAKFEIEEKIGVLTGIPIINYVETSSSEEIDFSGLDKQDKIIDFFSKIFGSYPFDETGAIVPKIPFEWAGLETQPRPIYDRGVLKNSGYTIVHELAHQWYGNSLSLSRWSDIWLNEGFATYAEILWAEHIEGKEVAESYMHDYYVIAGRETGYLADITSTDKLFSSLVYYRGALVLYALRIEIGDELFFKIIRVYTSRYAYSNVTTEDFISISEEISGKNLKEFFNKWLYEIEMPSYPN